MSQGMMRRIAAVMLAAAVPACSPQDAGQAENAAAKPDAAAQPAAAANVVTITARDYAFDAPDTIPAGLTTLRLVTTAGNEPHHMHMIKLEEGKTIADLADAAKHHGPLPSWAVDVAGPNAPMPGGQSELTQVLEPGNYAILCVIPSPDGTPHFAKGMIQPLTVAPAATAAAAEPAADVVMTLKDYGFDFSQPLTAGRRTIRVENAGPQAHEVLFVKLEPGKTPQDFVQWVMKPQGPPPGAMIGGTTGFRSGKSATVTLDVAPGSYALICFWPDAKDGKPHFVHGMMQQIEVGA